MPYPGEAGPNGSVWDEIQGAFVFPDGRQYNGGALDSFASQQFGGPNPLDSFSETELAVFYAAKGENDIVLPGWDQARRLRDPVGYDAALATFKRDTAAQAAQLQARVASWRDASFSAEAKAKAEYEAGVLLDNYARWRASIDAIDGDAPKLPDVPPPSFTGPLNPMEAEALQRLAAQQPPPPQTLPHPTVLQTGGSQQIANPPQIVISAIPTSEVQRPQLFGTGDAAPSTAAVVASSPLTDSLLKWGGIAAAIVALISLPHLLKKGA